MPRVGGKRFAYTERGRRQARREARKRRSMQRAKVGPGGKPMPGGRSFQRGEVTDKPMRGRGRPGGVMKGGEPNLREQFAQKRRKFKRQDMSRKDLKKRMQGEGLGADVARKMLMRKALKKQLGKGFVKKFQKGIKGKRHFQQIQRLKDKGDLSEAQQQKLAGLREERKELVSRRKGFKPGMTFNIKTGKWERKKKKQPRAQTAD